MKRSELDPTERWLVGIVAVHLCFLPWAFGTVHLWSQLVSLALSTTGLVVALRPRPPGEDPASAASRTRPGARLLRFPLFWTGLALLAYIAVQGLNPAWRYASNASMWWLEPAAPVRWLPSGMAVPFSQAGPWRALIILGSLWLLVGSVWIGFLRRLSYRILFSVLVVNAALLALFGSIQKVTGATKIFGVYPPSNSSFIASFIYRNHAGAYFNLLLALATGLAWWHYQRAQRRFDKSSPAGLYAFAGLIVGVTVLFTYSRTATFLLVGFVGLVLGVFALRQFSQPAATRSRAMLLGLTLVFAAFLGAGLYALHIEKVWHNMATMIHDPAASARDRTQAHQAAAEMLCDHWAFGWGAGCFRYGFPRYVMNYPEIYYVGPSQRMFWEHAHNDLLEFPIELGAFGMAPVLFALGFLAWQLTRHRFWANPLSLIIGFGCVLTVAHGWVDFVFQCPAILLTWGFLLVAARRWSEFDAANRMQG